MARGSVEQRGEHTWRLVVSDRFDPCTGKRRKVTRTITARNKTAAEKALTAVPREVDLGRHAAADANVAEVLERWIAARGEHRSPKTRNGRVATIRTASPGRRDAAFGVFSRKPRRWYRCCFGSLG
jgi:hypothetical protein